VKEAGGEAAKGAKSPQVGKAKAEEGWEGGNKVYGNARVRVMLTPDYRAPGPASVVSVVKIPTRKGGLRHLPSRRTRRKFRSSYQPLDAPPLR
jgi:hypothetical protein